MAQFLEFAIVLEFVRYLLTSFVIELIKQHYTLIPVWPYARKGHTKQSIPQVIEVKD